MIHELEFMLCESCMGGTAWALAVPCLVRLLAFCLGSVPGVPSVNVITICPMPVERPYRALAWPLGLPYLWHGGHGYRVTLEFSVRPFYERFRHERLK